MDRDPLNRALAAVVGERHVLRDDDVRAAYETDWTGRFTGRARCVVRPADAGEVAGVLAACHDAGVPVVPQGGNTGLVGGGVPRGGEVVLSVTRLDDLDAVEPLTGTVVAGAGVPLARLQAHAEAAGLAFGVDLAARDTATVGGLVATNAGGVHVLRHGTMRRQVLGVEAVLADGRVIGDLTGLEKDNTGYHLPSLLTGSEGTLAVVTGACLRLVPATPSRCAALLAVDSTAAALSVLARLRGGLAGLEATEIWYDDGMALVTEHAGLADPFGRRHPCYLLVEAAGQEDPTSALAGVLGDATEVRDAAVATNRTARAGLWAYRERHTEAVGAQGVAHKLDVTVPLAELAGFAQAVRRRVSEVAPGARTFLWGHLAEGNLHVNVLGAAPHDDAVDEAVLRLVAGLGGSISAEHGIGVAKTRWLHLSRSDADVAVMRAVKDAFDPAGLLNPGVLLA